MKPATRILIDMFRADREKWPRDKYPSARWLQARILRWHRGLVGRQVAQWWIDRESKCASDAA